MAHFIDNNQRLRRKTNIDWIGWGNTDKNPVSIRIMLSKSDRSDRGSDREVTQGERFQPSPLEMTGQFCDLQTVILVQ